MKRLIQFVIWLFCMIALPNKAIAQIGFSNKAVDLEDGSFVGKYYEPTAFVSYRMVEGQGTYGLQINIKTSNTYESVQVGDNVSIEFSDGTRDICPIQSTSTQYQYKGQGIRVYIRVIHVYPNFENLLTKQIKRIVIQLPNGQARIINTTEKRSAKLLDEFKKAQGQALTDFEQKRANNDYFADNSNTSEGLNADYINTEYYQTHDPSPDSLMTNCQVLNVDNIHTVVMTDTIEGKTAEELYTKTKEYIGEHYRVPNAVIKSDVANSQVVFQGQLTQTNPQMLGRVTVQFKPNRYRMVIDNIVPTQNQIKSPDLKKFYTIIKGNKGDKWLLAYLYPFLKSFKDKIHGTILDDNW